MIVWSPLQPQASGFVQGAAPRARFQPAVLACCVAALATLPLPATGADAWPNRPILLTVIGGPGSPPDTVARELALRIGPRLGQPIVIENQGAGGGVVGMDQVRRAAPDGYRFVVSHTTALVVNPALFKSLPYDTVRDFEPVSLLTDGPMILAVTPALGVDTVEQLVRLTKAKPGTLFYGSTGVAGPSHIFVEQFKAATGASIDHVPFKGVPGLLQALRVGEVPLGMDSYVGLLPVLSAGIVKPLAVSSAARLALLPNVPTFGELGIPEIGTSWIALLAPKGTPPAILAAMQREVERALAEPDLRRAWEALGRQVTVVGPEALATRIRTELPRWRAVIAQTGITPQ